MFRKFLKSSRGDYAIATAIAVIPIMGSLAMAVDYAEMSRQRTMTLNALDAAGIAAARYYLTGATPADTTAYAKEFFKANMPHIDVSGATFDIVLPTQDTGGGLLTVKASHNYKPYFASAFSKLIGIKPEQLKFEAESRIRLKNTLEVALVLDNSGSMDYYGAGSSKKRIDVLKEAANELVDILSGQATQMTQVNAPIQIGLVPFASSVNVGSANANETWIDSAGKSPMHYENFTWTTSVGTNQAFKTIGGIPYKDGSGWGSDNGKAVTRFSLLNDIKRQVCTGSGSKKTCTPTSFVSWSGCVESRPHPYNADDTAPSQSNPATLFVPMFAPDEVGNKWTKQPNSTTIRTFSSYNSWWDDDTTSTSTTASNQLARQQNLAKYFKVAPEGFSSIASDSGPNDGCTTAAITPLVDVTDTQGKNAIKKAIDDMIPNGGTNAAEGLAWGRRVVSSGAPFTKGRPESERGNDKVVILLTDGENTYYTPSSLGYSDNASMRSIYSSYGYTAKNQPGASTTRLFNGTDVSRTTYTNDNYTTAMNSQMDQICSNAKDAKIMVITVSLDLSESKANEKKAMEALKKCASPSKFSTGKQLFYPANSKNVKEIFKEIADELSNLRIVG